jgi:hypothetical protein
MRHIGDLLDGIKAIHSIAPDIWTDADDILLANWFKEYVDTWLVNNVISRSERASENNHGNYYDVQFLCILKYLKRCAPIVTLPLLRTWLRFG